MSRRPSALTILAVLSLLAAGWVLPLAPGTAAAQPPFGSRVFQANPYIVPGAQSYSVYAGSTVAQSFLVNETYYLTNVTLRVKNEGSKVNSLNVSIHPDNPTTHVPDLGTTLATFAEVTPNNASAPVNWSWPFSPAPLLQAGLMYWIVAQNGAPQASNGYLWYSTNGTTYPDGEALLGSPSWAGLPVDMFFVTFGQEYDANVTGGLTVDRRDALPNEFVTFTVRINNTGAQPAPRVWVNDTLPAALTNTSLSFPGIQPLSAAAFPNLVFANVTNGAHSFSLTAQIAIGTPPGSLVTNAVSVAFANATNVVAPAGSASASVRVGLVTKQLYLGGTGGSPEALTTTAPTALLAQTTALGPGAAPLEFDLTPALAAPLHATNVTATLFLGTQSVPPQTYDLSLSVLDNGTAVANLSASFLIGTFGRHAVRFAFPLTDYVFLRGRQVGVRITNLGASTDTLIVGYNSTFNDSHLDIRTDTYVALRPLSLANGAGPTGTWSTLDSILVGANVSDPFGIAKVKGVWINVTTPSGHLAASGPMNVVQTDPSSLPAWDRLSFTLAPPLQQGRYRIVVNALEDNGVTALAEAWASVAMPSFGFAAEASRDRVDTGSLVALTLWYNNSGTGPAGWAWVNDTLPSGLTFVGSNRTVTSVSGSTYTWALTDVPVGASGLEVDVLVSGTAVNWVQNRATFAYKDMTGHTLPTLFANTSLFLNGPVVALTLTSSPSLLIHANQTATYTYTLANSGEEAGQLWLNNTLPSGFTFITSNVRSLGGTEAVAGPFVNFTLPSLPANTTWLITLTAVAGPALARAAGYTLNATLQYTSLVGNPMPSETGSLVLTAASPRFPWASIAFVGWEVLPGGTVAAQVSLDNVGNEPASHAWVNLTVDPRLTLLNASRIPTGGSGVLVFDLGSLPIGFTPIWMNFTVNASAPDRGALTVVGTLDSQDGFGNQLWTEALVPATIFVHAAQMTLAVAPTAPVFEAGVPYPLTLTVYNWGSDTASNVWLNLTLPTTLAYVNDSFSAPPGVSGSDYSWHRTNVTPGSFSMQLFLAPRVTVTNGTAVALKFLLDYQGSNRADLPEQNFTVNGVVLAPVLVLSIDADVNQVTPPAGLIYTLSIKNTGMTTAETVYLMDSLDPRFHLDFYNATVSPTQANGTYNWTFTDLAPGQSQVVTLNVKVTGGTPANSLVPNAFDITYTNSIGVILGTKRSSTDTVTVLQDLTPFLLGGLAAAAFAASVLVLARRRKVDIEEVFLVYRDGVLISHLSRTLLREKDEDVLSGMLTAVQEFVREAFQYGEHRDLHQMDFGDYRILIERGKYVFLAIVYSGRESVSIHKRVRAVIAKIEHDFGPALENWDGDMEQVMGARDVIRDTLLGAGNHNHGPKTSAETDGE